MIYAGTGHRPPKLGGYSDLAMANVRECIRMNWPEDCTEVISGMALGFDMALAEVAVEKGIPFTAAIPFLGQESKWPARSQALYRSTLLRAKSAKIVSSGGYAPYKMQIRNEWMVDNAERVLALWNGTPKNTENCVLYALKTGKIVTNLWDKFQELRGVKG